MQATVNAGINFPRFIYPRFRKRNKARQTGITVTIIYLNLSSNVRYQENLHTDYKNAQIYKEKIKFS